eukprot:6417176-Amphidinium_carterae.1
MVALLVGTFALYAIFLSFPAHPALVLANWDKLPYGHACRVPASRKGFHGINIVAYSEISQALHATPTVSECRLATGTFVSLVPGTLTQTMDSKRLEPPASHEPSALCYKLDPPSMRQPVRKIPQFKIEVSDIVAHIVHHLK